jgi:hypothetical protein
MSETVKKQKEKLMDTYFTMGNPDNDDSTIAADLIFMREKGEAQQFLEISIKNFDDKGNEVFATKIIETEEEFNLLKEYFNQLVWEKI